MQDVARALRTLVEETTPLVADGCALQTVELADGHRALYTAHVEPGSRTLLEALCAHHPPNGGGVFGIPRVLATGRPELCFAIDREHLRTAARDATELALLEALAPTASITLPLAHGRELLGAVMVLMSVSGRDFEPDQVLLVKTLAERATVLLAGARTRRRALLELGGPEPPPGAG